MSDTPNPASEGSTDEGTATPPAPADGKAPKWEGEFDPDRAARLVENLRNSEKTLKERLAEYERKIAEQEDAEKSEAERLQARLEKAERDALEARSALLKSSIATEYGVPADLLPNGTEEEIKAKAQALAEWRGSATPPAPPASRRPAENLRPGTPNPASPPEGSQSADPDDVAKRIRARR